jgi:serine protease
MKTMIARGMFLMAAWQLGGCMVGEDEPQVSSTQGESFDEFRAATYQEPWEGGHFIVDGDTPIPDEKQLQEFWEAQTQGGLIVNKVGSADDRWNDTQKLNLTFCISNGFGSNKAAVVAAFDAATTQGWETRANVNFVYASGQDASCTVSNNTVLFNVRQVSGQPYLARAFFPSNNRASREVLIDTSSFGNTGWPLSHIIGHELGHTLGFRHEHTRPEAATCFEDNNWRPLTPYDSSSIMHYPQCNGASSDLNWTTKDAQGASALYGAPGGGGTPPPPPPPTGGTAKSETQTGSLAQGASKNYGAYAVKAGTTFTVKMTGTGDPDLYVRWGAAPTTTTFNCRPYLDGPTETCSLTVPTGQTSAYIMVRGYTAATYSLAINWTAP